MCDISAIQPNRQFFMWLHVPCDLTISCSYLISCVFNEATVIALLPYITAINTFVRSRPWKRPVCDLQTTCFDVSLSNTVQFVYNSNMQASHEWGIGSIDPLRWARIRGNVLSNICKHFANVLLLSSNCSDSTTACMISWSCRRGFLLHGYLQS